MSDRVLLDSEIRTISEIIDVPLVLFNEEKVLRLNNRAKQFPDVDAKLRRLFSEYKGQKKVKIETALLDERGNPIQVRIAALRIVYHKVSYFLGEIQKVVFGAVHSGSAQSAVYQLMLEMTQKMGRFYSEEEVYHFILQYAQRAVKEYGLCSIMSVREGFVKIVEKAGYPDFVREVRFPLADTFLYQATGGRCDRIVNIGDLRDYDNVYCLDVLAGDGGRKIRSTISAPIYISGKLTGMINFDSMQENAFDEEDTALLSLVRNNVEIALTNRTLYLKAQTAETDYLTGSGNRFYFEKAFDRADKENLWVALFDMNNLKPVNDKYGHAWGDRMICDFARKLEGIRREREVIARMGGDEFAGLFYAGEEQELILRLERLQEEIRSGPVTALGQEITYSFSYGICACEEAKAGEGALHVLVKCADDRMYEYKAAYKRRNPDPENFRG